MRARILAALIAVASAGQANAVDFKPYANARMGFGFDVPVDWTMDVSPGDGLSDAFHSPDKQGELTVYGRYLPSHKALSDAFDLLVSLDQDTDKMTYARRNATSATASGLHGDGIFWRRAVSSCGDRVLTVVSIAYPLARKAAYDPIVKRLSSSLRGGKPDGLNCP
jgi:serine/threonine-protein kinase